MIEKATASLDATSRTPVAFGRDVDESAPLQMANRLPCASVRPRPPQNPIAFAAKVPGGRPGRGPSTSQPAAGQERVPLPHQTSASVRILRPGVLGADQLTQPRPAGPGIPNRNPKPVSLRDRLLLATRRHVAERSDWSSVLRHRLDRCSCRAASLRRRFQRWPSRARSRRTAPAEASVRPNPLS